MSSCYDGFRAAGALRVGLRARATDDLERAREHCAEAARLRPDWLPARLWHGVVLGELDHVEAAIEELEAASTLHPYSAVISLFHGRLLIDLSRSEEASDVLERGAQIDRANLVIPGYLALALWMASEDEMVLSDAPRTWNHGGGALWGRWLLAIEERFPGGAGTDFAVDSSLKGGPLDGFVRWRVRRLKARARRLAEGEQFEASAEALNRIEMLRPGDDEAPELRVKLHVRALDHRRSMLARDPYDVDTMLGAAEDLLELGLAREALEILESASEAIERIDPRRLSWRAEQSLLLGRALIAQDRPREALEPLTLARDLWNVEVEPHYDLGVAALRAGERGLARRAFINASELDPKLLELRLLEYQAAT